MREGLKKLYTGDFNIMNVEILPDGSQEITLIKDGENKAYRFRVRNLYQENEEVFEEEVTIIEQPDYIKKRIMKAEEDARKGK
jgi:hypothetical protein